MFCPNCGKQLPDDSTFCEHCGVKIEPEQPGAVPSAPVQNPVQPLAQAPVPSGPVQPSPLTEFVKKNKKILGIGAGVLVLLIAVVVFIATRPQKVKLGDYVSVEFSGYDTMGNATYTFDTEAFCKEYAGKIEYQTPALGENMDDQSICQMLLQECVSGSLNKNQELTNGDEVVYEWKCDDKAALEKYDVKLSYEDIKFTVEGLEEIREVDPFENVKLEYTGTAPNGRVNVVCESTEDWAQALEYFVDPSRDLDNGDTVTVSIAQDDVGEEWEKIFLQNYGVKFTATEKEYTVDGLGSYLTKLEQVDSATLEEMKSRGADAIKAEAAQDWDEAISLDSATYVGNYLLVAKDQETNSRKNMLYLVYQVQSTASFPEEGYQGSVTFYYTVRFDNLIATPDGKVQVELGDYVTQNDRFRTEFNGHSYYFPGYENLDAAYRQCVTVNVDRYTSETSTAEQ